MRSTPHHIPRLVAAVLIAGAAMAPAAAADHQDLRSPDSRGPLEPVTIDRPTEELTFPGLARGDVPRQDLRMPDTKDAAADRPAPVVEFVRVSDGGGFDWADAGLGAAAAIGLVLIGTGGALAAARTRRRPAAGPIQL